MAPQHTKEQLWKLYKELPEELQEALFSVENADQIDTICEEYSIVNSSRAITKQIGNVLLGIVPVQEFENVLVKEVGLKKATAKDVSQRIYRAVFYKVKAELEQLHGTEVSQVATAKTTAKPAEQQTPPPESEVQDDYFVREKPQPTPTPQESLEEQSPEEQPFEEEPQKKSSDTYREPIN